MNEYQIVNDKFIDSIKDNFNPPKIEESELKNFKEKKLAEFQNKFADIEMGNFYNEEQVGKHTIGKPYFVEQFISDLIDEMEKALPKNKSDKYTIQEFLTNLNS